MHDDFDVRSSTPSPESRSRVVWDRDAGREWRVWLADCRNVPGSRSSHCLIFDSGTAMRRVWGPPEDWHALPDGELLALMERGLR